MHLITIGRGGGKLVPSRCSGVLHCCYQTASSESEYVDEPNYPPIITDPPLKQEKQKWHSKIRRLQTYEQKMMELNMPKAHGYYSCHLSDDEYKVNALPFLKFVTRTSWTDGLPDHYYKEVSAAAKVAAQRLAPHVEQLIRLHHLHPPHRSQQQRKEASPDFLMGLHRLLSTCLPFPTEAVMVAKPRVQAWWLAGGLHNVGEDRLEWQHLKKEDREKKLWVDNLFFDREEPFMGDICVRGVCRPLLAVRERHGLPPVEDRIQGQSSDSQALEDTQQQQQLQQQQDPDQLSNEQETSAIDDSDQSSFPEDYDARLHPEAFHYEMKHAPALLIPGHWPGEARQHSRLFYHSLRPSDTATAQYGAECGALQQQLITTAHTQGLAHAAMLGFGPVTELTYPLVQQSVATDGRRWHLALHQLNTVALHSDGTTDNPATNRLWVTPEATLWQELDPSSGAVRGLNTDLLARLAALYMKEAVVRPSAEATPFLAPYKYLWRHPASPYYRSLFLKKVQLFLEGEGSFWIKWKPELHLWEKIYKLDNNTMPRYNNNKRFYEGFRYRLLPQDRTCQDYIPRKIRVADRPLGKADPRKKEPKIDSEHLFVERYKKFGYNWRLEGKYIERPNPKLEKPPFYFQEEGN